MGQVCAVYGVYQIAELIVGVAFISGHVDHEYAFGNYIGILRTWRHEQRADHFLAAVIAELRRVAPKTKAIVFEVDRVDFDYLARVAHERPTQGSRATPLFGHGDDATLLTNLKNLKRLLFYGRKNAWIAVHPSKSNPRPAVFTQPALHSPYTEKNERALYFLIRSLTGSEPEHVTIGPFLDFAYDALYASAYPFRPDSAELKRALEYVRSVKRRVTPRLRGCEFQPLYVDDSICELLDRAEAEGFGEQLTL